MSGLARQLQREKQLLEEEILSMSRKMDDEKNMFMATAKAKEMAVAELKLHIVKNDEVLIHFFHCWYTKDQITVRICMLLTLSKKMWLFY